MEDIGKEMDPTLRETITARIQDYGYELFYDEDLIHNVLTRYEIYRAQGDVKCFINVGGNDASFGDSNIMVHADGGILTALPEKDNSTGLVQLFLEDGIPVIHLLNIKSLASEYGLPIDPVPLPDPGEGDVYFESNYCTLIAWVALAGAAFLLWLSREKRSR
jgi:poly-gamma-glutamate system protein